MSKFLENLDFSQNFAKSRFWSKFCKILENLECGQNSRKISILVKILENFDFGQIIRNLNFDKKKFFLDNLDFFFHNFRKNSKMVKSFGKSRFWSKFCKNLFSFFSNFLKSWFWSKLSEFLDFGENFENLVFGMNLGKISILIKILQKSWFLSKFCQIFTLVKIIGKSRF